MKKLLSLFAAITMLITSFTAVHCGDDITVTLDGQEIEFDVPPQIIDERTLVPMRAIFEALGAKVDWRESSQTIVAYRDGVEIIMQIGSNTIKKHSWPNSDYSSLDTIGEWKSYESGSIYTELDVPPMIIDERALVPVRAVSESLDCDVKWDGATRTVKIVSPQIEPPETDAPSADIPIEYDDTEERKAHYIRNFKITDAKKTDGGYQITYTLETFLEGRGTVAVSFNCYDSDGNVVDNFGGGFVGTDYTWSEHEAQAVISDKTVKIELVLN